MLQDLGVWKISVTSEVTGSKMELWALKTGFWAIVTRAANSIFFENKFNQFQKISELVCSLSTSHQFDFFLNISKPVKPEPGFPQVMRLRMYDSAPRVATGLKMLENY